MRAREEGIDLVERFVRQKLFSGVQLQLEAFFADLLEDAAEEMVFVPESPDHDRG